MVSRYFSFRHERAHSMAKHFIRWVVRRYSSKNLLGRPSNNLTSGIVGLANVGKSTFFQAITGSELGNPANYPFATIEPEEAKVIVPSPELDHLFQLYQSQKKIPATLTVYDIAGLTRNASQGEGLGNRFLNDIRHVDGIFSLIRGFQNETITHIEGSVDPVRDMSLVQDELVLKDLEWLEAAKERLGRKLSRTAKNALEYSRMVAELKFLEDLEEFMYDGRKIAHFKTEWSAEQVEILNSHNFITAKPSLVLLNCTPRDYLMQENKYLKDVEKWIQESSPGDKVVLFSAEFETKYNEFIADGDYEKLALYCNSIADKAEIKVENYRSALPQIIIEMRKLLNLISFYTCGPQEARQWTIREGALAPQAAGVIHTDLEKTFISGNVIKYADIMGLQPPLLESQLKSQGKIKRVGSKYIMEDGDIAHFKAAGPKK
ncbi:Ylf2p Ecym_4597 [Eremothecium cymbalariae DBVPG|uniref:Obg-like ATPase homolog n=1 Tax=Eremothecium cymbalariae (strain CBS 270.75 / DBVPG 7215 / KCTC 17166 / NRRL Y-17582) TaxID=931890 RepID=G8JSA7_ERECY|nr:hypothetical protein Ecym_4597 [Eremothecium cymbalariae DBVPG\